MNTKNESGRTIVLVIGVYLIFKSVLNTILGGGSKDILLAVIMSVLLYTGLQYVNYGVSVLLAITILIHLPANLGNLGDNWIYLLEGVIDAGCIALMLLNVNIKEHFTNK